MMKNIASQIVAVGELLFNLNIDLTRGWCKHKWKVMILLYHAKAALN